MFIKIVIFLFAILSFLRAASIIPLDSSVVNVKSDNGGKDYSYSIHENRAVAVESEIVQPAIVSLPIVQVAQEHNQKQDDGKQLDSKATLQRGSSPSSVYYIPGGYPVGYPYGYGFTHFYRFVPLPVL